MPRRLVVCGSALLLVVLLWATPAGASTRSLTGHSAPVAGAQANGASYDPAVSVDGRYVAFLSDASNLVGDDASADPNGFTDVYLADTVAGTMRLVSQTAGGQAANGPADEVDISDDGRYVVFASEASNLVPDDTNGDVSDIFEFDRQGGTLTLLSRKGLTGSQADGPSYEPSISGDGASVAFATQATNLVRNDTNGKEDIILRDAATGTLTRVSTDSSGKQSNGDNSSPEISANGAIVAFDSAATDLVKSDSGRTRDVYVKNLTTNKISLASQRTDGVHVNADSSVEDVSGNGRFVVMQSYAPLVKNDTNNRGDVFLRDRTAGTTVRVSKSSTAQANDQSFGAAISGDGSFVVFATWATNLLPGSDGNGSASDVLGYVVATGALTNISTDAGGGWSDGSSFGAGLSADGLTVVFASRATDIVNGDTNGHDDVFTHPWVDVSRTGGTTERWSVPCTGG
jgi:hypothetical protein